MSSLSPDSEWSIDPEKSWPPHGRPRPPFGVTMAEVLRSCPLRGCFEATGSYDRRISFSGRLGTALHRVLQSLVDRPPASVSPTAMAQEARNRFLAEVQLQEAEALQRPRERHLSRDQQRADAAVEAVMAEAQRLAREGLVITDAGGEQVLQSELDYPVEVEVKVRSADGVFRGVIDRAERRPEGTRIIDFKAALREDLAERYERQVQLYALMWHETRGEWPVAGEVVYPMVGKSHPVRVSAGICTRVGDEARKLLSTLSRESDAYRLAQPGDVCAACDFRPWCEAFWRWQDEEPSQRVARERARLGVQGEIISIVQIDHHWRVVVSWRGCRVTLAVPCERFPHLAQARVGTYVRILDVRLQGVPHQPTAVANERSEVFLIAGR